MHRRNALAALWCAHAPAAFALYDPKPEAALLLAAGAWRGTLTYRDWSRPDKLVTLPCSLSVALLRPEELALFYVFDDGPGKVVHGYDRMAFDFAASTLAWTSGVAKPATNHRITEVAATAAATRIVFERAVEGRTDRHQLELSARAWSLSKTELSASGETTFRNRYELLRQGT